MANYGYTSPVAAPWAQSGAYANSTGGGTNSNWTNAYTGPDAPMANSAANPYAAADTAYDYGGYTGGAQQYGQYYGNLAAGALASAQAGVAPADYGQYGVGQSQAGVNQAMQGEQSVIQGQQGLLGQQAGLATDQYGVANEQNALGAQGQGVFQNQGALAQAQQGVAQSQGQIAQQQQGVAATQGQIAAQGQQVYGEQQGLAGQQQGLASMLGAQALGGGPNPAAIQFQQGLGQSMAAQQAIAASARGGGMGLEAAERNAAGQAGSMQQTAVNQLGAQEAQQQLSAEQQLGAQQQAMGSTYGNAGNALANASSLYGNQGNMLGNAGQSYGNQGQALGQVGSTYGAQGQTLSGIGSAYGNAGTALGQVGSTYGQMGNVYGQAGSQYGQIAGEAANQAAQGMNAAQFGTTANLQNQSQQLGYSGGMTTAQQNVTTEQMQADQNMRAQQNAIGTNKSAQNMQIAGVSLQTAGQVAGAAATASDRRVKHDIHGGGPTVSGLAGITSDVTNKTDIAGGGPTAGSMIQSGAQGQRQQGQQQQSQAAMPQGMQPPAAAQTQPGQGQASPTSPGLMGTMANAVNGQQSPKLVGDFHVQNGAAGSGSTIAPGMVGPISGALAQSQGGSPLSPGMGGVIAGALANQRAGQQPGQPGQWGPAPTQGGGGFGPYGGGGSAPPPSYGYTSPAQSGGWNQGAGTAPGSTPWQNPIGAQGNVPTQNPWLAPQGPPAPFIAPTQPPVLTGTAADDTGAGGYYMGPSNGYYGGSAPTAGGGVTTGTSSGFGGQNTSAFPSFSAPPAPSFDPRQGSTGLGLMSDETAKVASAPSVPGDTPSTASGPQTGPSSAGKAGQGAGSALEQGGAALMAWRPNPMPENQPLQSRTSSFAPITSDRHAKEEAHAAGVRKGYALAHDTESLQQTGGIAEMHRTSEPPAPGAGWSDYGGVKLPTGTAGALAARLTGPARNVQPGNVPIPMGPGGAPLAPEYAPQVAPQHPGAPLPAGMEVQPYATPGALAQMGPPPGAVSSDERGKSPKEQLAHDTIDGFLDKAAESRALYRYKDPQDEPGGTPTGGRYLGVMAQALEKAPEVGPQIVKNGPRGKYLEGGATLSAGLAGLGQLHAEQKGIKRRLEAGGL